MNKRGKIIAPHFLIGFISFFVSALLLGSVPYIKFLPDSIELIVALVAASLFYIGLIIGIIIVISAKTHAYRWLRGATDKKQFKKQKFPGIITFSADIKHIVLYAVCVLGILVMVSDMIFHYVSEYIMFPIISLVFLTFALHCIVDGKNYKLFKQIKEGMDKGYEY